MFTRNGTPSSILLSFVAGNYVFNKNRVIECKLIKNNNYNFTFVSKILREFRKMNYILLFNVARLKETL